MHLVDLDGLHQAGVRAQLFRDLGRFGVGRHDDDLPEFHGRTRSPRPGSVSAQPVIVVEEEALDRARYKSGQNTEPRGVEIDRCRCYSP